MVAPANPADAHRPLGAKHDLAATLSRVETRQVDNDYTIALDGKRYQIDRGCIRAGLRGATVRVERRLDGSLAVRFRERYLTVTVCAPHPKPSACRQAAGTFSSGASRHDGIVPAEGASGLGGGPVGPHADFRQAGVKNSQERRARIARRPSRLKAQGLRSETSPKKWDQGQCGKAKTL